MKKLSHLYLLLFFSGFAVSLVLSQQVCADPPQDVALSYNLQTQMLTVTVTHSSLLTGIHYIKQIEIKKNNEPVSKNDYPSQPDRTTFVYIYNIPATENSIFDVTASCNIYGKKTATLTVK